MAKKEIIQKYFSIINLTNASANKNYKLNLSSFSNIK